MEKNEVVVVSAVRTPFGKFGGTLKDIPSIDLAAMVIREVLQRVNVKGEEVEETYYGTAVIGEVALETDVPARQATLKAGMPPESVSITLDRACCSSLAAVRLGFRAIKAGEIDIALGVGADNMSRAPYCPPSGCSMGEKIGKYSNMGWSIWTWVTKDLIPFRWTPERLLLSMGSAGRIRTDGPTEAR